MKLSINVRWVAGVFLSVSLLMSCAVAIKAEQPVASSADTTNSSPQIQSSSPENKEGTACLARISEQGKNALTSTVVAVQLRTIYMDRNKFDGSENEAWAIGGSAGLKTGYFLDFLALGATVYTSQRLYGPDDKGGTSLLESDQSGYTVIGEAYGDFQLADDLHLYAGRKAYDTPYINRDDGRMTPKTFEAVTLDGRTTVGDDGSTLSYGAGYFSKIKERNSDEFVPMSEDAGADVNRGVWMADGIYKKGGFAFSAYDYYSQDIINIAYGEALYLTPFVWGTKINLGAQYSDEHSTGDNLLMGEEFNAHQVGVKADLIAGGATFTVAYSDAGGNEDIQYPWGIYAGYTSVQVEDFNRDGEKAFMMKAKYAFSCIKGLSTYALWVNGTEPDDPSEYSQEEYNGNIQWAIPSGPLKGLMLRMRYALVTQDGDTGDDYTDFRMICYYDIPWK